MADPTLADVLKAISNLDAKVGALDTKLDTVRAEAATHRAESAAHRAETAKGFSDLDKELAGHADVHRELETDIGALKRRPARSAARAPRRTPKR